MKGAKLNLSFGLTELTSMLVTVDDGMVAVIEEVVERQTMLMDISELSNVNPPEMVDLMVYEIVWTVLVEYRVMSLHGCVQAGDDFRVTGGVESSTPSIF